MIKNIRTSQDATKSTPEATNDLAPVTFKKQQTVINKQSSYLKSTYDKNFQDKNLSDKDFFN